MEESGWNVYAVTTDDAQGKSATAYADDFFDEHSTEQEDGVALLIDMDNREITISTCGIAIRYLTDSRISWMPRTRRSAMAITMAVCIPC